MEFTDFVGLKNKIIAQKQAGDPAACLTFDEVDSLILIAREVWELRRTVSAKEADAKIAGYKEGQHDLRQSIRSLIGLTS